METTIAPSQLSICPAKDAWCNAWLDEDKLSISDIDSEDFHVVQELSFPDELLFGSSDDEKRSMAQFEDRNEMKSCQGEAIEPDDRALLDAGQGDSQAPDLFVGFNDQDDLADTDTNPDHSISGSSDDEHRSTACLTNSGGKGGQYNLTGVGMNADQLSGDDRDQFEGMNEMTSCQVLSGETIGPGDIVTLKQDDDPETWYARVIGIRRDSDDSPEIYVKVHWFYSKQHFLDALKRKDLQKWMLPFDLDKLGSNELVETLDHVEIYGPGLINGLAEIRCIEPEDERDVNESPLPNDGIPFSRIKMVILEKADRTHTLLVNRCICRQPDNSTLHQPPKSPAKRQASKTPPIPVAPGRFCPNSPGTCLRWFHPTCLQHGGYVLKQEVPMKQTFEDRLSRNIPSGVDEAEFLHQEPPTVSELQEDQVWSGPVQQALNRLARQPITREKDHPFGNMRTVSVSRVVLNQPESPWNWTKLATIDFVQEEIQRPQDRPPITTCYKCPYCSNAI